MVVRTVRRLLALGLSGELGEIGSAVAARIATFARGKKAAAPQPGRHAIDIAYEIDTGGVIHWDRIGANSSSGLYVHPFVSSQPSIIRQALRLLPDCGGFTFVDLGAGKGRALVVASEFAFRRIVGVELSSDLVAVIAQNARVVAERYPQRPKIEAVLSDVADYRLPDEPLVLFMYNPFFGPLMQRVVQAIERSLRNCPRDLHVVYVKPNMDRMFDRSPLLAKYFDGELAREESEAAQVGWEKQRVAIWRSVAPPNK